MTAETRDQVANSALVEHIWQCGLKVTCMMEPSDEYSEPQLKESEGKTLVPATQGGLKLPEGEEEKQEERRTAFKNLCKTMKDILGKKVEKVGVSNWLGTLPYCIVTSTDERTANMGRSKRAQPQRQSTMGYKAQRHLATNPDHSTIKTLGKRRGADKNERSAFRLQSGRSTDTREQIYRMITLGLGV